MGFTIIHSVIFKKLFNLKAALFSVVVFAIFFLYTSRGRKMFHTKFKLNDTILWEKYLVAISDNISKTTTLQVFQTVKLVARHLAKPLSYRQNNLNGNFPSPNTFVSDNASHKEKLILFYTTNYGGRVLLDTNARVVVDPKMGNQKCPRKCAYTEDKSMLDIADAVVFGVFDIIHHSSSTPSNLPKINPRKHNQIWVGYAFEPSIYHWVESIPVDKLYNWTASYRLDSDVYWPYGYFFKPEDPIQINSTLSSQILKKKTKLAASLISNCWTHSNRESVIKSLKKYIPIDSYGSCGDKHCPEEIHCRKFIGQHYKFFLAFENSLCQDYITEKFFECYQYNLVPVTLGLGDYAEIAPPNSYINALEFPTTKALAEYLIYLDKNDEEYLKYFEWKREYVQGDISWGSKFCSMCLKLWEPLEPKQISEGFNQWWRHKRRVAKQINNVTLGKLLLNIADEQCVRREEINRVSSENNYL